MRLLLSILILLALVVAGLAGFWWLGGPDAHRWVAVRTLELVLKRDVHVDGTLEVEPGAEPLLQLTGLRIDSPPWAETPAQLQIARAQIKIALRPLLRRALVFRLVDLEGVTIALETAADGRHSWQSEPSQPRAPPREARFAIPLFDRLSVSDATVTYHDRRDGRRTRLHIVSLTYQGDHSSRDMRLDADGDIDGKALRMEGTSGNLETALAATVPWPLELEIQLPSIDARLAGTVADVAHAAGLDLRLEARSRSLLAAAQAWNLSVPVDGQITAAARLGGDLAMLSLAGVSVEMISSDGDRLQLSGSVGNVWEGSGLDGRATLKLNSAGQLGKLLPLGWPIPSQIEAAASVAGTVAALAFDDLSADIRGPGDSRLRLAGSFRVATPGGVRIERFDLTSSLEAPRIADLFDVGGPGLERFRFEGKLAGAAERFDAEGRAGLGETQFDGGLTGDFSGARPSFKGRLHSPQVRLADLGLTPAAAGDATPPHHAAAPAEPHLFGREPFPLDSLQKLDLDLEVQLDSLKGVALAIDQAKAHVMLTEGRLQLSPLRFDIVGGYAEVNAEVDARAPTPKWRMRAEANDVDLGNAWRQLETDVPLSGQLDLALDLQASGRSPRDLANSISGDLNLALQRGRIQSRLFGLTTMNPARWLVAPSTLRGYSTINCFVARSEVDNGVAELRTLVLDTPNVIAGGTGFIDFARETLDVQIRPSAKQRRLVEFATPFAITGSLAKPSVSASTTGAATRALARVALSPVNLLGSLLPFVNNRGADPDNPCLTLSIPTP